MNKLAPVDHSPLREPRTTIFAMATINSGHGSVPVKIRNMSRGGALIEGGVIPAVGSRVRLCRGSLVVAGRVTWTKDGQGGLRFEGDVRVTDWLPRGRSLDPQQRVDEIFQKEKAAISDTSKFASDYAVPEPKKLSRADITELQRAITSLGDDLAKDCDVVSRHGQKLQTLDVVAQALAKLASER